MKQAIIYSLKVWLTALVLSPTVVFPIWILAEWIISYTGIRKGYNMGIVYGIDINISTIGPGMYWCVFYYLPYLILIVISVYYLQRRSTTIRYQKGAFTALAVVLTLCPFVFFKLTTFEGVFNMQLARVISFGLFFIAGIWFYKLKPVKTKTTNISF
jgi:hypothetical protein